MPLTCLAITACLLLATPAAQRAPGKAKPDDVRARVETHLGGHDVSTAAELRNLSAAPEKALMSIALDPKVEGLVRARAVAALRVVPTLEARAFLGKLVQDQATAKAAADRLILRRAAIALGWLSGPEADKKLALLFENEDPEVRLDAVIGLGLTRAAGAPDLLRRQLAVEQAPRVREQIERQLRALGQPPPKPEAPPGPPERTPMRGGL